MNNNEETTKYAGTENVPNPSQPSQEDTVATENDTIEQKHKSEEVKSPGSETQGFTEEELLEQDVKNAAGESIVKAEAEEGNTASY